MAVEVTDATFDGEVCSSPVPVVVEFYATWCGSCRRIAPVLDELAEEFRSRARLVTVNADENPELVSRFGVSSTPTLFALVAGERVASVVGAQPVAVLRGLFEATAGAREGGCGVESDAWVSVDACTLPTADRPARLAEFEALFSSSLSVLRREESGWLRLWFGGGAEVVRRWCGGGATCAGSDRAGGGVLRVLRLRGEPDRRRGGGRRAGARRQGDGARRSGRAGRGRVGRAGVSAMAERWCGS